MTYYLFKNNQTVKKVFSLISSAKHISIFLDYDGTLTPIKPTPAEATLPKEMKTVLILLANTANINLSIITGRSLKEIKMLIGLKNINYAANHGFEIYQNKIWQHPNAKLIQKNLKKIYTALKDKLKIIPKVFIENKGYTLSIHYRNVDLKYVPQIKNLLLKIIHEQPLFKISHGKKVFEIRSKDKWNKGIAVTKIFKSNKQQSLAIYIGDDNTDEDAFNILKKNCITIKVGKQLTAAKYYVKNTEEVLYILWLIYTIKTNTNK